VQPKGWLDLVLVLREARHPEPTRGERPFGDGRKPAPSESFLGEQRWRCGSERCL